MDVTADGQTVYKDTTSPEDTVNWVLGYGEPEGDKFQIKADEDADNFGIVFKKKLKKKTKIYIQKSSRRTNRFGRRRRFEEIHRKIIHQGIERYSTRKRKMERYRSERENRSTRQSN